MAPKKDKKTKDEKNMSSENYAVYVITPGISEEEPNEGTAQQKTEEEIIREEEIRTKARLKIESEFREMNLRQDIEKIVKMEVSPYAQKIVGLENLLKENDLFKAPGFQYNRDLILVLKSTLKSIIEYKIEQRLLEPDTNKKYDEWLEGKSFEYPKQFNILEEKVGDLDLCIQNGQILMERIRSNQALEKIAIQAEDYSEINKEKLKGIETYEKMIIEPFDLITAYHNAIAGIIKLTNEVVKDPVRRSAVLSTEVSQQRMDRLVDLGNTWIQYYDSVITKKGKEHEVPKETLNYHG